MPESNESTRRTARERSQARMNRGSDSVLRVSTDSYGRARQESTHLSQSRYSRQAPRQASQSSRELEESTRRPRQAASERRTSSDERRRRGEDARSRREGRPSDDRSSRTRSRDSRDAQQRSRRSSQVDRRPSSRDTRRQPSRDDRRQPSREKQRRPEQQQDGIGATIGQLLEKLPSFAAPVAIAVVAFIVLLVLVFGVLAPSCSQSGGSSDSSTSSSASSKGLVYQVGQAQAKKRSEVETANQVGSLETSNANVQALVALLGEEETAKLIAQAKTNPDALWIAAHPDAYAFDGIEIQYKILKLAADEPASIKYVREFPAKYPMNEPSTDKELAMDVASPSSSVPNTKIPHLYQWDRRWAYTIYSSATFGLTGCGPTSLAMVYQGLNRTVDKTPFDMAVLAESRGYMSEFNGTDSAFFIDTAPELGLTCWEAYPDAATIRDELSQGHVIIANLGPGYFTTNGHFFVLAGLTDDGQVIVNDPYSVVRSSQTWDTDFIATETMAMFVYSKA